MAVCSFSFAETCVTTYSGAIASDGTGAPGAPVIADLTTGCGCGTINSITITFADLVLNCNSWFLYDVTYDGTGGTTLTGVCDADITNLSLPIDATSITLVQYDCCGDGLADNVTISFDVTFDFTDDGTCPTGAPTSCITPTPVCTDQGLVFAASTDQPDASTTNPNVNYGCQITQPNPEWFYLQVAAGGTLDIDVNNSNGNDIDWAAWGPFTSFTELTTNCSSGALPFNLPIDCDYTTATSGVISLGTVSAGDVYAVLVNNFDNTATNISLATSTASTASTDCSIVGGGGTNCAATCADAASNGCNLYVTPTDTPPTSYAEILAGGGESCLAPAVDVSAAPVTVVQCFNYTHNTPGSSEISFLSGVSMTEFNDTDGISECDFTIDQVELFDAACNSLGFGGQWTGVPQGATFTVCVSVTAENGATAEGNCFLNCLAHAVTPITATGTECAATCTDASTNACNVYIAPVDTPPTSYIDIQNGGGEACFLSPIDVSTAAASVTQCFNYTHSTPGSSEFNVLIGLSVLETNDTNNTNDCNSSIDQVEIFDINCVSLGTGGVVTGVPQGATYTICVTASADNGTAEGDCIFQCLANSITPITSSTGDCAATCADASTNTCNHYETAVDTPVTSYTEIQNGGGESCLTNPIDVTNGPASVTHCFTYTHTAAGTDGVGFLSGLSVSEFNDTNGTNDCVTSIDSIEVFDLATCTSLGVGAQGAILSPISIGDQFTICVTGTASNGTAEGNCSFDCMAHSVTPVSSTAVDCAANCAAVDTTACNVFVTASDTPPTTYGEIQTGGGESCFSAPIDVSTTAATVTQCFEYTHNTPGSSVFTVLSGASITENNDTNGTNDCGFTIDQIEFFDSGCNSLGTGGGLTSAVQGVTYTICVTTTANNGTAEGNCSFDCLAHAVTPITAVCDETYAFSVDDVCSDEAVSFTQNAGCDAGPGTIDLDFYIYAPGGAVVEAPAGYDPFQGGTFDTNYPISDTDLINIGGVGPGWGGTICDDLLDIVNITNRGCGPVTASFFVLPWDREYDTDIDSTFGEYNTLSCAVQRYDVVVYPSSLRTEVTNDGSTCGLPQITLLAADSTVCETLTGSQCSADGDAFNYDFGPTATATALSNAPTACALPALTGTINCSGCTGPQDCATLVGNGTDICLVIVDGSGNLDPNHPLSSQDCDNGGVDNYTECLSGEDPSDPADDCTTAADESLDICALISATGSGNLIISGVGDGPLTGGTPKFVELYVVNNIADLSVYGLESANNGGGTSGVEFTFPAAAATAGSYIYVATSTLEFNDWFGFMPDYTSISAVNVNGDDAVVLYENSVIVDVVGDINVDGTGTSWEYTNGFAYRNSNTGPSATFVTSEWTFSGIDAWVGETDNASAVAPFPTGTFTAASGGGNLLGAADCDGDGVTNADECADSTDPLDPCSYEDLSITGPVTADQTSCACPDLSPILNLLPNNISGASNINIVAEIVELGGADTDGSTIKVRLPSDPRFSFTYDPTLMNIGFNPVQNADWTYTGNNGVVHEFTYNPAVLVANGRTAFGYVGVYDPQATDGQTTLTVTIVPLSGGECVFTNNTDAETLIYFD